MKYHSYTCSVYRCPRCGGFSVYEQAVRNLNTMETVEQAAQDPVCTDCNTEIEPVVYQMTVRDDGSVAVEVMHAELRGEAVAVFPFPPVGENRSDE